MNIARLLLTQVSAHPDEPAIVEEGRVTTFAELDRASAAFAGKLRRAGLRAGDGVIVFVPMSATLYAVLIGTFRAGLVATLVDPSSGRAHVERCCALRPPRAFVGTPKAHLLRLVSPALRSIPHAFLARGLPRGEPDARIEERGPDAGALLTFTSGSTGEPKAALRTHGFLLAQHEVVAAHVKPAPGKRLLVALPVFVLSNLAAGATSLIPPGDLRRPGRIDAQRVLRWLEREPAQVLGASPAFFERLLEAGATFASATLILTGGGPVFPHLLRGLAAAAPRADVVALYGSTEAEPIAMLSWKDISADDLARTRAGEGLLAGVPVPELRVRIVDDEVWVAGEHVLRGYLGGKGDAATKVREGDVVWHRTGDAARVDARGRLWLLGRVGARIADERGVVWPFAVEAALAEEVGRCALVQHEGKRVLVATRRLSSVPPEVDEVRIVREVPLDKRHDSKVDYPALQRLLGGPSA